MSIDNNEQRSSRFSPELTLEQVRLGAETFAIERDWVQFHSPRNLLLALVGEVGELAELFQWRPDSDVTPGLPTWTAEERTALGEELSDVLIYLARLADQSGIDLASACTAKMHKNALKYPVQKCRGSSAKYTQYTQPPDESSSSSMPADSNGTSST